jgi:predicted aldo/keto reductase-like oxidoreductase
MVYRKFGKTNELVSTLGFGCMRLPLRGKGDPTHIDEEKAIRLVRCAIDNGVNYIDTAYPYHGTGMARGGASEPFVARALKDGYREKVKIATKLPSWLIQSRKDMDKYLHEQLQRLNTNTIDFYLVHAIDRTTWPQLKDAGIKEFLNQAVHDGRINHAGFSFHDKLSLFKEIIDQYDWSFCQIQYNYLDENYQAGTEGLVYAAHKGLGVAIMEPLRGGKLVHIPEDVKIIFDRAEVKKTPAEWGLRWVLSHPEVSVVLSGMNEMEQVLENIKIASDAKASSLTEKEVDLIEKVRGVFAAKIKINCTACEYCMPCPQHVDIPKNFDCYNDYYMFGNSDMYHWVKPDQRASNCIECGECETHCPQGISIGEELKNVVALFE